MTQEADNNEYHQFAVPNDTEERLRPTEEEKKGSGVTSDFRYDFEKDRDRILYSKAFRRLSGKTQVFIAGYDDHVRTRLTHTLEVAQIAKTISNHLGLNTTLTEAIALGHDLGHTPFGHVGEDKLAQLCKEYEEDMSKTGFKHNWHSLRVVDELELRSRNKVGLNLTHYTRWGILHHSKTKSAQHPFYLRYADDPIKKWSGSSNRDWPDFLDKYWSIEGVIVNVADEIAQRHHDLEDGLITGIISTDDMLYQIKNTFSKMIDPKTKSSLEGEKYKKFLIPKFSSLLVNYYVIHYCQQLKKTLDNFIEDKQIADRNSLDIHYQDTQGNDKIHEKVIADFNLKDKLKKGDEDLETFLRERILNSYDAQKMDGKSNFVIKKIFEAYNTNPRQLPDNVILSIFMNYKDTISRQKRIQKIFEENKSRKTTVAEYRNQLANHLKTKESNTDTDYHKFQSTITRTIIDFIAGMTDDFALHQYEILYGSAKPSRY